MSYMYQEYSDSFFKSGKTSKVSSLSSYCLVPNSSNTPFVYCKYRHAVLYHINRFFHVCAMNPIAGRLFIADPFPVERLKIINCEIYFLHARPNVDHLRSVNFLYFPVWR